jgi:hypothetical protein
MYKMQFCTYTKSTLYIYKMQVFTYTKCSFVHIQNAVLFHIQNAVLYIYKMQLFIYKTQKNNKYFD